MQKIVPIFLFLSFFLISYSSKAQSKFGNRSIFGEAARDSNNKRIIVPRVATLRSAILPGWGQIYNRKYWKLPLVYGAIGVTAGVFVYNVKTYKNLRTAYILITDTFPSNDGQIDASLAGLRAGDLRSYRNSFRQNVDYSVLFFLLFWGLNVVDATVDSHLKAFDVSDNLSLQIKPGLNSIGNTAGISLILNIGKRNSFR